MASTAAQMRKREWNVWSICNKAWSQQSQQRYKGHNCHSTTSVLAPGLFNPLLHVVDFQDPSLLHRFGVTRVAAAQVQVMSSIWDHDSHKGIADVLGHPTCRPWIQATVTVRKPCFIRVYLHRSQQSIHADFQPYILTGTDLSLASKPRAHLSSEGPSCQLHSYE